MKTLLIGFDGVIHSYTSGWKGAAVIPDPPVDGALDWLQRILQSGEFNVCIYSARSPQYMGAESMKTWLFQQFAGKYGVPAATQLILAIQFPKEKPPAFLTIDARCIPFNGSFTKLDIPRLRNFKSWLEKKNVDAVR